MRRLASPALLLLSLSAVPRLQASIAPWEVAGVATGALGIGITEIYKKDLVPDEARWKTPPAIDASVRSGLVWSNTGLASTLSDVMLYGVMPTSAFLLPLATNHDYSRSALAIAEAAVMTGVVTQVAKFSFARARPYAYYGNDYSNPDSKLSFFSGHSSYSFALSLSSAMLLAESYPKYSALIYSVAVAVASLPAYLRIAADKHYLTDVLTGAIVGSAIAYGVVQLNIRSNSIQYGDERRLVLQRVFVLQ
jgi:membrane-associated phospholipid phosphatase